MAGSNNCEVKKKKIIRKNASRQQSGKMKNFSNPESPRSNPQSYPTNFRCKMDPGKKKKEDKRASPEKLETNPLP